MRYGSVCSGIEAATVAWKPLGWTAVWFSEIEKFPRAVLEHHYPDVPLYGDFTQLVDDGADLDIDVLVGGTPCQGFSVAGVRGGMKDDRSNLALEFVRLANAVDDFRAGEGKDPVCVLWENVPGVFSLEDNAFGCFLGALVGDDAPLEPGPRPATGKSSKFWRWAKVKCQMRHRKTGRRFPWRKKTYRHVPKWPKSGLVVGPTRTAAWRVLDAQYFGLAQQRQRVFVVASAGGWADPGEILFESGGMRRDIAPSREEGESVAGTLEARASTGGYDPGAHGAASGHLVADKVDGAGEDMREHGDNPGLLGLQATRTASENHFVAGTVEASFGRARGCGQNPGLLVPEVAPTITAQYLEQSGNDLCKEGALIFGGNRTSGPLEVSPALSAHGGAHGRLDFESEAFVTAPLTTRPYSDNESNESKLVIGFNSREDPVNSEDRAGPLGSSLPQAQAICSDTGFITSSENRSNPKPGDPCHAISAQGHIPAVAFHQNASGELRENSVSNTVNTNSNASGRNTPMIRDCLGVRRLTPTECERLQGFPDKYTAIDGAADGPRYKAVGNSMATHVMKQIGEWINIIWIKRKIVTGGTNGIRGKDLS